MTATNGNTVNLTAAQARHVERLANALAQAQAQAQRAQSNANDFLGYCAEELGINAREYRFVQERMCFEKVSD